MQIEKNTVVTLEYRVNDSEGFPVDEGAQPLVYLHGGYEGIFDLIEESLQGKRVGDRLEVRLEPADAFGEYDESLVSVEDRSMFPEDLELGMQLEREVEGCADDQLYTVTDITSDKVVTDGNHPLAGMALQFLCTVATVRQATAEEVAAGGPLEA